VPETELQWRPGLLCTECSACCRQLHHAPRRVLTEADAVRPGSGTAPPRRARRADGVGRV